MSELSVGSKVIIRSRHGDRVATIKRETKTQWITGGVEKSSERRFRKENCMEIGCDSWSFVRIELCTKDIEDDLNRKNLITLMHRQADFSKLSLNELKDLWEKVK